MTMGDVVRAMARGENVCPNQVTITPRMSAGRVRDGRHGDVP